MKCVHNMNGKQVDFCANNPCPEGHQCMDHGNDFSCECPEGRSGLDCSQIPRTVCFIDQKFISIPNNNFYLGLRTDLVLIGVSYTFSINFEKYKRQIGKIGTKNRDEMYAHECRQK